MNIKLSTRNKITGLLFLLPSLLFLAIFFVYPIIQLLYTSFFSYNVGEEMDFIGWANYVKILPAKDFWFAGYVTFRYAITSIILELIGGFIFALTYNTFKATKYLRGFLILPLVVPIPIFAVIWQYIYQPQFGLLNVLLKSMGIIKKMSPYLTDPDKALNSIVIAQTSWTVFVIMFLLLSGMQGIKKEYYEAAQIDGAGAWKQFTKITLPLMKPTITFIAIFRMMDLLQSFTTIFLIGSTASRTSGMERNLMVWAIKIYKEGFMLFKLGSAASMSVIVFFVILLFILLYLKVSKSYSVDIYE